LASAIQSDDDNTVTLTGYSSDSLSRTVAMRIARARVRRVESYLREQLALIGDPQVKILARAAISQGSTVTAKLKSRSVVALLR
jgi:hypothetical protein